jgi:glycosyltransferase involved in cell wall biosynthesis
MKTLYFFTATYPFPKAAEQTFIEPELSYLAKVFDKVVIIPLEESGVKEGKHSAYNNVWYKVFVAAQIGKPKVFLTALSKAFQLFLFALRFEPKSRLKPLFAIKSALYVARIHTVLKLFFAHENINNAVFYSYWFEPYVAALSKVRTENTNISALYTRAHGIDVYAERRGGYIPFQHYALHHGLNAVFSVSAKGAKHLQNEYPKFKNSIRVAYLGVSLKTLMPKVFVNNTLTIVSCSSIIALKRVDLIAKVVIDIATMYPQFTVSWFHFGSGNEESKLKSLIQNRPKNLQIHLMGNVENTTLLRWYANNVVDLFVNLSTTEGVPVSIMEAISFGIPILATNVGGNPEIVTNETGWLVNVNDDEKSIAHKIDLLITQNKLGGKKQQEVWRFWNNNFNAEKNYLNFAKKISE